MQFRNVVTITECPGYVLCMYQVQLRQGLTGRVGTFFLQLKPQFNPFNTHQGPSSLPPPLPQKRPLIFQGVCARWFGSTPWLAAFREVWTRRIFKVPNSRSKVPQRVRYLPSCWSQIKSILYGHSMCYVPCLARYLAVYTQHTRTHALTHTHTPRQWLNLSASASCIRINPCPILLTMYLLGYEPT